MVQGWRTVRVFISSTFKDMQAERDHLVRFVFPRLREELLKRRIKLVDVDLRWGVTSEQDAVEVCQEIIDECRPRFLCLLGGRYGWTPPGREESITAQEIRYAVLNRVGVLEYRFFYFRDPRVTAAIPEAAARAGGYREFPTAKEIAEYGEVQAELQARRRAEKLEALKREISDAGFTPFSYPARWEEKEARLVGLEAFGEKVYADLLWSIDAELGEETPEEPDEFAAENLAMEAFAEERVAGYMVGGRREFLEELRAFAAGRGEPNILVVTGATGSGKSALLSKFCRDYVRDHPECLVIPHFVGASIGSTDLRRTLRRLCHELYRALGEETEIPQDIRELLPKFSELLQRVSASRGVVLIIDALSQMDAAHQAHSLHWLPYRFPANVRFIASSLEHPVLEVLRRRGEGIRVESLQTLGEEDRHAIIRGFLERFRKAMTPEQVQALLAKAESGNPLYLLTALEELRTLGTYEEITRRIEELPDKVQDLFGWILGRLEEDPGFRDPSGRRSGPELVRGFASLLGVSRFGLSQRELNDLLAPGDPGAGPSHPRDLEGNLAGLLRLLRPYLMQRGELLDFHHSQLKEAAQQRYLGQEEARRRKHQAIGQYFNSRWREPYGHALSELPYHLTQAGDWPGLKQILTDLSFIESKCALGMAYELVSDYYTTLGLDQLEPTPPIRTAWRHRSRCGVLCPFCLAWSEVAEEQLGQEILCPKCQKPLALNSFSFEAEWSSSAPRRGGGREPILLETAALAELQEFAAFVRTQAHILNLMPQLTFQQAANQPGETAPAKAAASRQEAGLESRPWLRCLKKEALPAGGLVSLEGHTAPVQDCDFSPDGAYVVSASDDKTLKVWNTATGAEVVSLVGHSEPVKACVFSPDGEFIGSLAADGTAKLWDGYTGAEMATLRPRPLKWPHLRRLWHFLRRTLFAKMEFIVIPLFFGALNGATIGGLIALGYRIITAGLNDLLAALFAGAGRGALAGLGLGLLFWVLLRLRVDKKLRQSLINKGSCAFSPDGAHFAASFPDHTLRVWETATGKELPAFAGHTDLVTDCKFSPDGSLLLSGSADGTLKLWDLDGSLEKTLKLFSLKRKDFSPLVSPRNYVTACAFSPDGSEVISAGSDGTLQLWNVEKGKKLANFGLPLLVGGSGLPTRLERGGQTDCAFLPDGSRIISACVDGMLRIWHPEMGDELAVIRAHDLWVTACVPSPEGRRVVSASIDNTLKIWDLDANLSALSSRHQSWITALKSSPDGTQFVTSSLDKTLKIWDSFTGAEVKTLYGHTAPVINCAFLPDGTGIVSLGRDGIVKVWDAFTGESIATTAEHAGPYKAFTCSPEGSVILAATKKGALELWETFTGEMVGDFRHGKPLKSCLFSPDGVWIASAASDSLKLWNLETGEERGIPLGRKKELKKCAIAPDGSRIVAAFQDNALKIWQMPRGEELATLEGHSEPLSYFDFSPDGTRLVSCSYDGDIRLWNALTGAELETLRRHGKPVMQCVFSPCGALILSVAMDRTARLWDAATGRELGGLWTDTLFFPMVAWRPDGRAFAVSRMGREISLVQLENLPAAAPFVTAWRSPASDSHAFHCPYCNSWSQVDAAGKGQEVPCPQCEKPVKLCLFAIHGNWEPLVSNKYLGMAPAQAQEQEIIQLEDPSSEYRYIEKLRCEHCGGQIRGERRGASMAEDLRMLDFWNLTCDQCAATKEIIFSVPSLLANALDVGGSPEVEEILARKNLERVQKFILDHPEYLSMDPLREMGEITARFKEKPMRHLQDQLAEEYWQELIGELCGEESAEASPAPEADREPDRPPPESRDDSSRCGGLQTKPQYSPEGKLICPVCSLESDKGTTFCKWCKSPLK